LFGTCVNETRGEAEFVDKANKIECVLTFGRVKKKPSDYFQGTIKIDGKIVSTVEGTYLGNTINFLNYIQGWIEIDGIRYFDYRYTIPFKIVNEKSPLGSDFCYRPDIASLQLGA